eukprot:CAMPEP_0196758034 /NCGR_PEP_ID=MMETSP1091-20130531/103975_1 /TAXON_ID=302021 /ORGANISM="Rhodomonas sp., Strain CCMP768" /LENGTH=415 /DNA_ID=CAMNT_0042106835 /DNA_START=86 /DNA_END=1333 /DNA_ORIENTATION=+
MASFADPSSPSSMLSSSSSHGSHMYGSPPSNRIRGLSASPPRAHGGVQHLSPEHGVVIRPRRRKEEASPEGLEIESDASPVVITREVLSSLFSLPLSAAADRLRISVTSLKKICRSFGVRLWPYRFQQYQDKLSSDPAQASAEVGVCAAQNGCGGTENGGSAAEVNAWSASARDGEWTRGNVGSVPGAVPAVPTPRFAAPATNLSTWEHAPTGVYHTLHHHVDAERRVWQQYQDKLSSDPAQSSAEVGVCAAKNGCGGTENGGSAAEVNTCWSASASARDGEWTRADDGSVPGGVPAVTTTCFATPGAYATNLSTWEHAPTGVYHTLHHHVDAERRVWHHSVTEQRRPDPDGRSDSSVSFRNQATPYRADAPGTLAPATRSELCSDEELRFVAALAHRRAKENRESDRDVIVDEW